MDILSYPVGLLIGLFPVIVDLGGRGPIRSFIFSSSSERTSRA